MTSQRRSKSSAYPEYRIEHEQFKDTGCDVAPHCLTCPLPRCRFDEPRAEYRQAVTVLNLERNQQIRTLMTWPDATPTTVAATFGVSRRTVFRVMKAPA